MLVAAALAAILVSRGEAAPADGTARLVPPDAMLYVHVSTSAFRTQDSRLESLAGRFTTLRTALPALAMEFTPAAGSLSFARDVRPWLGDEAALALVTGGDDRPEPLLVASVRDSEKAVALLRRLGARPVGTHRATQLLTLPPRAFAAFAGEHLVVGPEDAVRGAIDRAAETGGPPSLADGRVFRRAAADRDSAGSVDVFATSAGLRRLLDGGTGLAGFAGRLVTSPRLEGIAAQLSAEETGLRLQARIMRAPGGPRRAAFEPALDHRVPEGSAGYVALPGLAAAVDLIERAGGGPVIDGFREALPGAAGLELEDVLAPLAGEAALTLASGDEAPVFTLTARTPDEATARGVLARLQEPIAARLGDGAPFAARNLNGAQAFTLDVTPQLQPSYVISGGTVVASTHPSGLAQQREARTPISEDSTFEQVRPREGARVEALGFLDPRQLLALAERTGLTALGSPALRDDLRRIRTAGAAVVEDANRPSDTTAELFLEIP